MLPAGGDSELKEIPPAVTESELNEIPPAGGGDELNEILPAGGDESTEVSHEQSEGEFIDTDNLCRDH